MARPLNSFWLFLLGLLGLHLAPVTALASDAGVLCSQELQGESTRAGDVGCIDVLAWSWGQSNPVTVGGGGPPVIGTPNFQGFNFTKFADSTTDDFFRMVVSGSPIKSAEYRQYRDCGASCEAPEPYLIVRFRELWTESVQNGSSGAERPSENVTLTFLEVTLCYRPTTAEGTLDTAQCFAFSRDTNTPITPF